jgi:stress-induced morphogen
MRSSRSRLSRSSVCAFLARVVPGLYEFTILSSTIGQILQFCATTKAHITNLFLFNASKSSAVSAAKAAVDHVYLSDADGRCDQIEGMGLNHLTFARVDIHLQRNTTKATASKYMFANELQITEALKPTSMEIFNDSHKHAHHKAMKGSTSQETHFRYGRDCRRSRSTAEFTDSRSVFITSEEFKSKMQPARHRMVYGLLKDEMAAEGGIHALQLRTRTPEEDEKAKAKEES